MRLQHGGEALYRESLQVATHEAMLFVFRKNGDVAAQITDFCAIFKRFVRLTACRRSFRRSPWCCLHHLVMQGWGLQRYS